MKATMFAVVWSFLMISLSTQVLAQNSPQNVSSSPPVTSSTVKKININQATSQELAGSFKGIGVKRAETIVSYRETHGAYKSVEELAQVHGLGKTFVNSHLSELQAIFSVE